MFYSTDGTKWTSAGTDFQTAFAADANNNGFTTAPGQAVNVSKPPNVAGPPGGPFYLAWNYSVQTGATTSNAQALAIDDITLLGARATRRQPIPRQSSSTRPRSRGRQRTCELQPSDEIQRERQRGPGHFDWGSVQRQALESTLAVV